MTVEISAGAEHPTGPSPVEADGPVTGEPSGGGVGAVGHAAPTHPTDEWSECGCGLWICRDCRPEEFAPGGRLYREGA